MNRDDMLLFGGAIALYFLFRPKAGTVAQTYPNTVPTHEHPTYTPPFVQTGTTTKPGGVTGGASGGSGSGGGTTSGGGRAGVPTPSPVEPPVEGIYGPPINPCDPATYDASLCFDMQTVAGPPDTYDPCDPNSSMYNANICAWNTGTSIPVAADSGDPCDPLSTAYDAGVCYSYWNGSVAAPDSNDPCDPASFAYDEYTCGIMTYASE